jgi:ABC-2 type transport system permease protein
LDRVFAAGVPSTVLIVGSLLTHSLLLIVQASIMLIITVYVFKVTVVGSVFLVFAVQFLLGIVGQSFGLFVSAFSHEEREAVQFTLAAFFPSLLLSGTRIKIHVCLGARYRVVG